MNAYVNAQISTVNAEISAVTTAWTANAASQEGEITSLRANITAANAVIATQSTWLGNLQANVGNVNIYEASSTNTLTSLVMVDNPVTGYQKPLLNVQIANVWSSGSSIVTTGSTKYVTALLWTGNALLAATDSSGMLRSTDGGNTWATVTTGSYNFVNFTVSNGIIFATTGAEAPEDNESIWQSSDGGITWTVTATSSPQYLPPTQCWGVAVNGGTPGGVVGSDDNSGYAGLIYYNNSIDQFSYASVSGTAWGSGACSAWSQLSNGTVYASNNNGIYISTSYGLSWTHTSTYVVQVDPHSGSDKSYDYRGLANGFVLYNNTVFAASTSGIIKSTDGGNTWTLVNSSITYSPLLVVDGTIIAGLYTSADGGNTWVLSGGAVPGNYSGDSSTGGFISLAANGGTVYGAEGAFNGTGSNRLFTSIPSGLWYNASTNLLNANINAPGSVVVGTGVFWANGTAYSSGSSYGNTQVAAYLPTDPTIQSIESGATAANTSISTLQTEITSNAALITGLQTQVTANAATLSSFQTYANATYALQSNVVNQIIAGANITITPSGGQGIVTISATGGGGGGGGGASFNGNLTGNALVDTTNNHVLINASPYSAPTVYSTNFPVLSTSYVVVDPSYSAGVLQPTSVGTGAQSVAVVASANILFATGSGSTRSAAGGATYLQARPSTQSMSNTDRLIGHTGVVDYISNGASYGTYSSPGVTGLNVRGMSGVSTFSGSGFLNAIIGTSGGVQLSPNNGAANVYYMTGLMSSVSTSNGLNATMSNVQYSRLVGGYMSFGAGYTINNAVGLHIPSGWATTTGNTTISNKYSILSQDTSTTLSHAGNINVNGNNGVNNGIIFADGTFQNTASSASLTWSNEESSNFTATAGQGYFINTINNPITVTLPASPSKGQTVGFVDAYGIFGINNFTIYGNGANVMVTTGNLTLGNNWEGLQLVYENSTNGWIPYSGVNNGTLSPPAQTYTASYLIVAGGGGSGASDGGGSGAGGLLSGTATLTSAITYSFTVGAGGGGSSGGGNNGTNSTGLSLTAIGGGQGGSGGTPTPGNGGSGGGAGNGGGGSAVSGGSATTGQGYTGGSSTGQANGTHYATGGGGGAGGVGGNADTSNAGNGGIGVQSSITGTATYYAGGGGGTTFSAGTAGTGGAGGGGSGTTGGGGGSGTANTGGGGAGGAGGGTSGGSGGSGVVIISVPTANYTGITTGSPTVTTNGSNTIMTFTSSGSYTA
jgi:hypothetical protein